MVYSQNQEGLVLAQSLSPHQYPKIGVHFDSGDIEVHVYKKEVLLYHFDFLFEALPVVRFDFFTSMLSAEPVVDHESFFT